MPKKHEELSLERASDESFVLTRTDGNGERTEIALTETNVIFLARLAPTVAGRILKSKTKSGSGVLLSIAPPVKSYDLGHDLHNQVLLLKLRDVLGNELEFSFKPSWARELAEKMIARANKIENAKKPTKQ